jgi:hypothetical protein
MGRFGNGLVKCHLSASICVPLASAVIKLFKQSVSIQVDLEITKYENRIWLQAFPYRPHWSQVFSVFSLSTKLKLDPRSVTNSATNPCSVNMKN